MKTGKGGVADAKRQTDKVVCVYCCRSFPSFHLAEEHERSTCLQNPDSNAIEEEPYSLVSLYRDIRPPPALTANERRLPGQTRTTQTN